MDSVAVQALCVDGDGRLWIATGGGYLDVPGDPAGQYSVGLREGHGGLFVRERDGRTRAVLPADGAAAHWIWALAPMSDGTIAAGTEDGLWRRPREGLAVERVPLPAMAAVSCRCSLRTTRRDCDSARRPACGAATTGGDQDLGSSRWRVRPRAGPRARWWALARRRVGAGATAGGPRDHAHRRANGHAVSSPVARSQRRAVDRHEPRSLPAARGRAGRCRRGASPADRSASVCVIVRGTCGHRSRAAASCCCGSLPSATSGARKGCRPTGCCRCCRAPRESSSWRRRSASSAPGCAASSGIQSSWRRRCRPRGACASLRSSPTDRCGWAGTRSCAGGTGQRACSRRPSSRTRAGVARRPRRPIVDWVARRRRHALGGGSRRPQPHGGGRAVPGQRAGNSRSRRRGIVARRKRRALRARRRDGPRALHWPSRLRWRRAPGRRRGAHRHGVGHERRTHRAVPGGRQSSRPCPPMLRSRDARCTPPLPTAEDTFG